jgi:hypothetical protein
VARKATRTQACSDRDARTRLEHARTFLEVADLVAGEGADAEYSSVSAALAVLAGIAASDAACCKSLGRRARGEDHRQAVQLVEQVEPGGHDAARALRRLLALKDEAHYGLFDVGGNDLRAALRQARSLTDFAAEALLR